MLPTPISSAVRVNPRRSSEGRWTQHKGCMKCPSFTAAHRLRDNVVKSRMNNHTTARIGKRVHVILNDGSAFIDKLKSHKARIYEFETHGKIGSRQIRSFSIARPKESKDNHAR